MHPWQLQKMLLLPHQQNQSCDAFQFTNAITHS
jgi:hypothetical protein